MPKMKTNRSAAKRFEYTGTGKLRRRKACKAHLNIHKGNRRLRRLGRDTLVNDANFKTVKKLISG